MRVQFNILKLTLLLFLGILILLGGIAYKSSDLDWSREKRLKVLSTTSIINDLVKNIGGEQVNAVSLMGADIDPHIYQASEDDFNKLLKADVIFYNGLYLEAKLTDVLTEIGKNKPVYAVSELIEEKKLIPYKGSSAHFDPHIWFDLTLWQEAALLVRNKLVKMLPEQKVELNHNYLELLKKLDSLDKIIINRVTSIPVEQRILVTGHDAFSYFGRRYGFRIEGLKGISTASKVGLKDIQRMVQLIIENDIPTIFFEATLSPKDLMAVMEGVQARGGKVKIGGTLLTDALGEPETDTDSYIKMIVHNVKTMVKGLMVNPISSHLDMLDELSS